MYRPSAAISKVAPGLLGIIALCLMSGGCALFPDVRHRDRFHNPLPQLHRIAVLPFFNQSAEPTLDQIAVAEAYYAQLQAIPGFEVIPVGVAIGMVEQYASGHLLVPPGEERPAVRFEQIDFGTVDFQDLARAMGVDAVVVGAVTDYTPYSPPRLAMTVRWYAANPAFHPVPAGYGLPWGTKAEKEIPRRIVLETELEVARAQLATQTPIVGDGPAKETGDARGGVVSISADQPVATIDPWASTDLDRQIVEADVVEFLGEGAAGLPADWPDPSRLIPDGPNPMGPPPAVAQRAPVLTHTRIYRGDDPDFTERLADYVYAMDDGRLGGWQGYLTRSDDFIRFCCYLHITEMLEMRGGRDESDLILRWPISRYSR